MRITHLRVGMQTQIDSADTIGSTVKRARARKQRREKAQDALTAARKDWLESPVQKTSEKASAKQSALTAALLLVGFEYKRIGFSSCNAHRQAVDALQAQIGSNTRKQTRTFSSRPTACTHLLQQGPIHLHAPIYLPDALIRPPMHTPLALGHAHHHLARAVHRPEHARDAAEVDHAHVPFEGRVPHDLARAGGVHADDAAVAKVEDVAGVLQLVGAGDGDGGVALARHEGGELVPVWGLLLRGRGGLCCARC